MYLAIGELMFWMFRAVSSLLDMGVSLWEAC